MSSLPSKLENYLSLMNVANGVCSNPEDVEHS